MRVEVIMPQMGESIVEGTIVAWHRKVGDKVRRDEDIFAINTDKVDAEIPSPSDGVLVEIVAQPGDTVDVGAVVAWIETDAALAAVTPPSAPAPAPAAAPAAVAVAPSAPAPAVVVAAAPASAPSGSSAGAHAAAPSLSETADALRRRRSTPLVRKIAEAHGIDDLGRIEGTGVSGRVTKDDILKFIASGAPAAASAAPASAAPAVAASAPAASAPGIRRKDDKAMSLGEFSVPRGWEPALVKTPRVPVYEGDRVEPMTRMRASIAENMLQARRTTAHCHTVWEADVTALMKLRKKLQKDWESRGVKLTMTPFFLQAVLAGLREYPILNASIDGDRIVHRASVNLGVASAVEEGLIVPVIKGADTLNLFGLAKATNDLANRSKNRALKPEDVADGTFTVTNSGIFGSLFGIPILVAPQVGILNFGGVKKRVVADEEDNIRVRSIVTMCLTFDHRLIDGAAADGFMAVVTRELGQPKAG